MEAMTLEFLRDWHKRESKKSLGPEPWFRDNFHYAAARLLEVHLAQPAQAVDVGAIQEVAGRLMDGNPYGMSRGVCRSLADRLTRALSGEKAGPVGDGWQPIETAKEDDPPALVSDGKQTAIAHIIGGKWVQFVSGVPMLFQPMLEWRPTHWQPLSASPTPDKEGV